MSLRRTIIRVCEECGDEYVVEAARQRWCCAECREIARNEQRTAARRLWARAGKPTLEEVEQGEAAHE